MIAFPAFCEKRRRGSIIPTSWTLNTNHNISNYILDIEYGSDGYWVICGVNSSGNGVIDYRQTNPTSTFTAATSGLGTSDAHTVNYDGSTNWTVGATSSLFRYKATPPSGSWSNGTSVASGSIYTIGSGNGYWCTGSSDAYLRYKTNISGAWTNATTMSGAVRCITYGSDGYWVAGSVSNNLKTASSTPISWTNRTSSFGASDYILNAEYSGTYWVITSSNGDIAYATDPTGTWTHVANPGPFVNGEWIGGIAYGNGVWVISGSNGKLATATDPTSASNWTQQTIGFGTSYADSVYYGNGYWVVGGYGTPGKLAYSQVTV